MANAKISELTELTTLASNDLLEVSENNGDTTFTSKKIQASNLKNYVNTFNITYTSHGLTIGVLSMVVPIAKVGSTYSLAKANSVENCEVIGVAIEAIDVNTLKIQQTGIITRTVHGFVGPTVILSATVSGGLTETAISTSGYFIKPILKVIDANTLEIIDYPAIEIASPNTKTVTFTDSDLLSGVYTFNHNLGQKPVVVTLMDNNGNSVDASPVFITENVCTIDLSNFGTISGTWKIMAMKGGAGSGGSLGGMWELVERKVFASAATSYTFSGLPSDIRRYRMVVNFKNVYAGLASLYVTFNTDTTAGNYPCRELDARTSSGVSTVTSTLPPFATGRTTNDWGYGEMTLEALTTVQRFFEINKFDSQSGTISVMASYRGYWASSAPITQLVVTADQTSAIGVGSYIELWKLSQ